MSVMIKNIDMPIGCQKCKFFRKHMFGNGLDYSYSCILGAKEFPMPWIRQLDNRAVDCPILEADKEDDKGIGNLCDSCTNIGCEFQSGIVRTKCAFYMPPHIEPDNCGNYAVMQEPSAQPEIIKCKDCKYWREHKYAKETKRYIPFCGFNAIYTKSDDFCSRAERRENDKR